MKTNYVILKSDFDMFKAYIRIGTDIGTFEGRTEADEIDQKYPSSFNGYEIALSKALKKYAVAAMQRLRLEIRTLNSALRQILKANDNNYSAKESKIINGMMKDRRKQLKLWQIRFDNITKSIQNRVAERDRLVKRYVEKEKTSENLDENN